MILPTRLQKIYQLICPNEKLGFMQAEISQDISWR